LTNADIIGDVEYFKVDKLEELEARSPIHPREQNSPFSTTFPSSPLKMPDESFVRNHRNSFRLILEVNLVDKDDIPEEPMKEATSPNKSNFKISIKIYDADKMKLDEDVTTPVFKGEITQFGKPTPLKTNFNNGTDNEKTDLKRKATSFQNALAAGSPSFEAWVDESLQGKNSVMLKVWHATKLGTDTDFLRIQSVRHFFKNNALAAEDAQLYQMPDVVEEEMSEVENDSENRRTPTDRHQHRKGKCSCM
jgi:hypothetical protein